MTGPSDRLWEGSMPEAYDRYLGSAMFAPHAIDLTKRAKALEPMCVLELAAGTGIVTSFLARELPDARITATDLNQAMVDYGAAHIERVEWSIADAQQLPFEDGQFDLVICQFGVMFFPDKLVAYREARRVLQEEGHLLFNTWNSLEHNRFAEALNSGLAVALPDDPPNFVTRIPHGYSDVERIRADVEAAGFIVEELVTVELTGLAPTASEIAKGFCYGTPIRLLLADDATLDPVVEVITAVMIDQLGEGEISGTLSAHVLTARR